jgi:hypothetical protein
MPVSSGGLQPHNAKAEKRRDASASELALRLSQADR